MTDQPRYDALKEEIRRLTPFIYVQTVDPHSWVTFLKGLLGNLKMCKYDILVASTPAATAEVTAIESKLAEYAKDDGSIETCFFVLAHARLTDQMVHSLKLAALARAASDNKWVSIVIVINDEPIVDPRYPEFVIIIDDGPSPSEVQKYLAKIALQLHSDLPIDELTDITKGMSFAQIDRVLAVALVTAREIVFKKEPIPIEIFRLAAKNITPAYSQS